MYDSDALKKLVGLTIARVSFAPDMTQMFLDTEAGRFTLDAEGDCCSHSVIDHVDNETALIGKVLSVRDVEQWVPRERPDSFEGKPAGDYEDISYYALAIVTDKGEAIIDYRNSSNGYYGGWLNVYLPEGLRQWDRRGNSQ